MTDPAASPQTPAAPGGRRVCLALILLWLVSALPLGLLYLTLQPSPDQSQFDYMALISTMGGPYYAASMDMNWPGIMMLHELGLRLFGVEFWSWRLTDFLLMQVFALGGALFLRRAGFGPGACLFLFLHPLFYTLGDAWAAGQRDVIATGFTLLAAACAVPAGRAPALRMLGAGAFLACAMLVRPTFLAMLPGLLLLEFLPLTAPGADPARLRPRVRRAGALLLGFAAVVLAVVAAGLALGNLDDWVAQSFGYTGEVYAGEPPLSLPGTLAELFLRSWPWLTAAGGIGLVLWALRGPRDYALWLTLGLVATTLVSYVVQQKGFGYHVFGLLTVLTLWTAAGMERLGALRAGRLRLAATGLMALIALAMAAGTAKKLWGAREAGAALAAGRLEQRANRNTLPPPLRARVLELIAARKAPGDRILQYAHYYDVPVLAQLPPAHRFLNMYVFELMQGHESFHDPWVAEIEAAYRETPPAFVLLPGRQDAQGLPMFAPDPEERAVRVVTRALLASGYEVLLADDRATLLGRARP